MRFSALTTRSGPPPKPAPPSARLTRVLRGKVSAPGPVLQEDELGVYLFCLREVQVLEDGKGLLPGAEGSGWSAGGQAGVAYADEGLGFFVPVAEVPEQLECALIGRDGLGVVTEMVAGVTHGFPRRPR